MNRLGRNGKIRLIPFYLLALVISVGLLTAPVHAFKLTDIFN